MTTLLRALGFVAWGGCLATLCYQAIYWVITAHWPSLTLLDGVQGLTGIDLITILQKLPLEYGYKAAYVFVTTELSISFWWVGVFFFATTLLYKVVFKK